jgi:activator of HSP90 ATPase
MAKTIIQTVRFKARPEVLYALYANSKKHTAALGSKAVISSTVGGKCSAYDGTLTGRTLGLVPGRVFVQTWRAEDWTPDQPDSVLALYFEKDGKGGRVTMVHANIPDEHHPGIKTGWTTYYWTPWKKYLSKSRILIHQPT